MKYSVFIGSSYSDVADFIKSLGGLDDGLISDLSTMPFVNFYPLYNKASLFSAYKNAKVPKQGAPFFILGDNEKSEFQLATTLCLLVVPTQSVTEDYCGLKSNQFGKESFCLFRNTGILFEACEDATFYYFVNRLRAVLLHNIDKLNDFYASNLIKFDLMTVHKFKPLPCEVSNQDGKIVVSDSDWNVCGSAIINKTVSFLNTKQELTNLGTMPNYFFENHCFFPNFKEFNVGVEK